MYDLTGVTRPYAWGSTTSIQNLLGLPENNAPLAEMWFGAHPTGPSPVTDAEGRSTTLDELIETNPDKYLGKRVAAEFGGTLPFLVKFLAPGQPVSLQVHPTPENAQTGFIAEQIEGVPLDAPHRSFKDTHHKPEMVFAITEFSGLVGFRDLDETIALLAAYEHPAMRGIHRALAANPNAEGMRECLKSLVELSAGDVDAIVSQAQELVATNGQPDAAAHQTVADLSVFYPSDAGSVASLMLNRMTFSPGECVYVASGTPHAYLSGLCVEIMANSDNVFRAGLTNKYVDVEGLLANTAFSSSPLALLPGRDVAPGVRVLAPGASEFQITSVTVGGVAADADDAAASSAAFAATPATDTGDDNCRTIAGSGPRVAVCIDGDVIVRANGSDQTRSMKVGQAIFAPDSDGDLSVSGAGQLVIASVP